MQRFAVAPWPTALKVVSLVGGGVLVGVSFLLWRTIPHGTRAPFAVEFGTAMAFVPMVTLVGALLFVVTGYELDAGTLRVQRLLSTTVVPLDGLSRAWQDPKLMCGSLRVWGNGGLFSITGLYRKKELGTYRAFVTDPAKAVVLVLPKRPVVLSPADPAAFLDSLRARHPGLAA